MHGENQEHGRPRGVPESSTALPEPGARWREDFPIFRAHDIAYLDSGASAQKPEAVLAAMDELHRSSYANIHRGVYALSQEATSRFESARETVQRFVNAASPAEIVFTR